MFHQSERIMATVARAELSSLMLQRCDRLRERIKSLRETLASLPANSSARPISLGNYSSASLPDPRSQIENLVTKDEREALTLSFMADHLSKDSYDLDEGEVRRFLAPLNVEFD